MKKPSLAERETIIRWSMADKQAFIYADNPTLIRKLDKLCAAHPESYRCTKDADEFGAKRYEVDVKYIRFGKPASKAQREHALSIAFTAQNRPQPAASLNLQPCG